MSTLLLLGYIMNTFALSLHKIKCISQKSQWHQETAVCIASSEKQKAGPSWRWVRLGLLVAEW